MHRRAGLFSDIPVAGGEPIFRSNSHGMQVRSLVRANSLLVFASIVHTRGITVRKLLICALALGGVAASAQAADLDSLKDPLPDTLTYKGVTLYGTVDVGYAYQSQGYGPSGAFYPGLNYSAKDNKTSNGSQSTIIGNAMSQSTVGLKVEESLGMGFVAIGKVETGFNPTYGELADACKSLLQSKRRPSHGSRRRQPLRPGLQR